MAVLPTALSVRRLLEENATLRTLRADLLPVMVALRADLLPVMVALLSEHVGSPGARIATDELHDLIDADLQTLREHLPLSSATAKAYCDD